MRLAIILSILSFTSISAQNTAYNLKKGFVAQGYDVVEYFNENSTEGNSNFQTTYDGAKYKFISESNLNMFKANPKKYIPQYGGYCAYAVAINSQKVSINPKNFEIRDGKLYLFYNSWGNNTLEKWEKENPEQLVQKANKNWEVIK